jgi:hypothetical protein
MDDSITYLHEQIARCRRLAVAIVDADFQSRLRSYESDLEARLQHVILASEQDHAGGLRQAA